MVKRSLAVLLLLLVSISAIGGTPWGWNQVAVQGNASSDLQSMSLISPANDWVKIAVIQFCPVKDKDENLERMESYLGIAGSNGADLVIFPELSTTYYPWFSPTEESIKYYQENAETIPEGKTTQLMAKLAKEYGMFISWGMVERASDSGRLYDSQVLLGPDGAVVGIYRKIHLAPGMEEAIFTPGDEIRIYDTSIGKIAIMIGYDRRFPELARTYSLMGAEVILLPAATADRFIDQYILVTRAYENSVWLVFANQVGSQPGGFEGIMHGDSRITDQYGRTRGQASGAEEEVLWLEVERSKLAKDEYLLKRRRPQVYREVPIIYPPTKEEVIGIVVVKVLHYETEGKALYVTPEPLPAGTVVWSWTQEIRRLPTEEWLVFIDDSPEANWEHPCRYVFVDNAKRTYVVIAATSPPRDLKLERVYPPGGD